MNHEDLIWKKLDNVCSTEELEQFNALVKNDADFQTLFSELKDMHELLQHEMPMEAPKSITRNVMYAVEGRKKILPFLIRSASTSSILPWVIGFSILAVVASLGLSDLQINGVNLPEVDKPNLGGGTTKIAAIAGAAMLLLGLDRYLHFRHIKQEMKK